jgi:regulator of replication initiation timing
VIETPTSTVILPEPPFPPAPPSPPASRPRLLHRVRKSRWLPWTLAGLFLVTTISLTAAQPPDKTAQVNQLQASLGSAHAKATDLQSQIASLQSQIASLQSSVSDLTSENGVLSSQVAKLDERAAQLDARAAKLNRLKKQLDARAADLKEREAAVSLIEESSFDDGLYHVGVDIKAGTYHTTGGSGCYWAKLSSSDTFDIISNNLSDGPQTVTINSSWFDTQDCGTWTLVS